MGRQRPQGAHVPAIVLENASEPAFAPSVDTAADPRGEAVRLFQRT